MSNSFLVEDISRIHLWLLQVKEKDLPVTTIQTEVDTGIAFRTLFVFTLITVVGAFRIQTFFTTLRAEVQVFAFDIHSCDNH
jgi:hypothetical protein